MCHSTGSTSTVATLKPSSSRASSSSTGDAHEVGGSVFPHNDDDYSNSSSSSFAADVDARRQIAHRMCYTVFGHQPGKLIACQAGTPGLNEFLSAAVAVDMLVPWLSPIQLLHLCACIEITIPFRPQASLQALKDRCLQAHARLASLSLLAPSMQAAAAAAAATQQRLTRAAAVTAAAADRPPHRLNLAGCMASFNRDESQGDDNHGDGRLASEAGASQHVITEQEQQELSAVSGDVYGFSMVATKAAATAAAAAATKAAAAEGGGGRGGDRTMRSAESVVDTMLETACKVAARDVGNFASHDTRRFLSNTWKLIPELNPALRSADSYTFKDWCKCLAGNIGFFQFLANEPYRIYPRHGACFTDAEYRGLLMRASANLERARAFIGARLITACVLHALLSAAGYDVDEMSVSQILNGGLATGAFSLAQAAGRIDRDTLTFAVLAGCDGDAHLQRVLGRLLLQWLDDGHSSSSSSRSRNGGEEELTSAAEMRRSSRRASRQGGQFATMTARGSGSRFRSHTYAVPMDRATAERAGDATDAATTTTTTTASATAQTSPASDNNDNSNNTTTSTSREGQSPNGLRTRIGEEEDAGSTTAPTSPLRIRPAFLRQLVRESTIAAAATADNNSSSNDNFTAPGTGVFVVGRLPLARPVSSESVASMCGSSTGVDADDEDEGSDEGTGGDGTENARLLRYRRRRSLTDPALPTPARAHALNPIDEDNDNDNDDDDHHHHHHNNNNNSGNSGSWNDAHGGIAAAAAAADRDDAAMWDPGFGVADNSVDAFDYTDSSMCAEAFAEQLLRHGFCDGGVDYVSTACHATLLLFQHLTRTGRFERCLQSSLAYHRDEATAKTLLSSLPQTAVHLVAGHLAARLNATRAQTQALARVISTRASFSVSRQASSVHASSFALPAMQPSPPRAPSQQEQEEEEASQSAATTATATGTHACRSSEVTAVDSDATSPRGRSPARHNNDDDDEGGNESGSSSCYHSEQVDSLASVSACCGSTSTGVVSASPAYSATVGAGGGGGVGDGISCRGRRRATMQPAMLGSMLVKHAVRRSRFDSRSVSWMGHEESHVPYHVHPRGSEMWQLTHPLQRSGSHRRNNNASSSNATAPTSTSVSVSTSPTTMAVAAVGANGSRARGGGGGARRRFHSLRAGEARRDQQ